MGLGTCYLSFRGACNLDSSWTEQTISELIAPLELLDNRVLFVLVSGLDGYGFVKVLIGGFSDGFDRLQAHLGHGILELLVYQRNSLMERFGIVSTGFQAHQGAFKIIQHRQ